MCSLQNHRRTLFPSLIQFCERKIEKTRNSSTKSVFWGYVCGSKQWKDVPNFYKRSQDEHNSLAGGDLRSTSRNFVLLRQRRPMECAAKRSAHRSETTWLREPQTAHRCRVQTDRQTTHSCQLNHCVNLVWPGRFYFCVLQTPAQPTLVVPDCHFSVGCVSQCLHPQETGRLQNTSLQKPYWLGWNAGYWRVGLQRYEYLSMGRISVFGHSHSSGLVLRHDNQHSSLRQKLVLAKAGCVCLARCCMVRLWKRCANVLNQV